MVLAIPYVGNEVQKAMLAIYIHGSLWTL